MCKFCEEYKLVKEIREMYTARGADVLYSVALIDHDVKNGETRGRTVHYMKNDVGFPLNYCPECGKNLRSNNGWRNT